MNGRKLGKSHSVGHEVHFLCDLGFELVGSESRICQESLTWSGQQPTCRGENPAQISSYLASLWWEIFPTASPTPTSVFTLTITHPVICPTDQFYNPVIILFVTSSFIALYCHSSSLRHACHSIFYVEIHFISDLRSYFLFIYFECCPERLLNAVTCDIPASLSSDRAISTL